MADTVIQRVTTPAGDPAWLVTNYDDVKALLSDSRLGRSHADPERAARVSHSAIFGGPMGHPSTEAAEHARVRRLLAPAFSARRMASLRPRVMAIITDLLDAMARQTQPADLQEAVSFPLPALVICELLGVPYADREDFRRWSDDAAHQTDAERSQTGLMKLWQYMRELVDRKRAEPDDDVISDLVAAAAVDPELTADGIAMLSAGLLFAGHETTVTAIDRGVILLLTHPGQADALRHDPALIEPAVEEILRSWLPMRTSGVEQAAGLPRYANTDFTFGGVTIQTGELVMLGLRTANLDERHFPEPDRFDVRRTRNPHLTFGHGPHFCVGAPLARIELQTLFPALLDRFPTLRLAVPVESLRGRDELLTGGLVELPVTW
ncbi:MAG: cytochrome P450 [Pseudonocardiaceae bacterium]